MVCLFVRVYMHFMLSSDAFVWNRCDLWISLTCLFFVFVFSVQFFHLMCLGLRWVSLDCFVLKLCNYHNFLYATLLPCSVSSATHRTGTHLMKHLGWLATTQIGLSIYTLWRLEPPMIKQAEVKEFFLEYVLTWQPIAWSVACACMKKVFMSSYERAL